MLVPLGTSTSRPSMVSFTVSLMSALALASDVIDHAEDRHDVGDQGALDLGARGLENVEARRAAVQLVRPARAVGDDEEAELAVATLGEAVGLTGRHADAVHDDLEVVD